MRLQFTAPLAAVLIVSALTGCGPASTSPPTSTPAPAAAVLRLQASQAGASFTVAPGQQVELTMTDLRPFPGVSTTWTANTSNAAALKRTGVHADEPTGFPRDGYAVVIDFVAVAPGRADITATSQATCEAMNPAACHGPDPISFHITVH